MKSRTFIFLVFSIIFIVSGLYGQSGTLNEDSLWSVKRTQLKNYTQINDLVAKSGYKYRKMHIPDEFIAIIPNLSGPDHPTTLPAKKPSSWKKYAAGENGRLAVFLTDTTSNWLGLTGGLSAQGIPFRITRNIDEAVKHKVIIMYPALSSDQFSLSELRKLREHPKAGGVLIGFNITAPSMRSLFGFEKSIYSPNRKEIFLRKTDLAETEFIREVNEVILRIGDPRIEDQTFASIGYDKTTYQPIAQFEDGSAAIIRNLFNNGATYGFGFDLGFLTAVSHTNLHQAHRTYINDYEPSVDVMFRLIKRIYQMYEPDAVVLGTVPFAKLAPVLITHDIDCEISVDSMLLYADMEKKLGIKATYFIQTKYIKDGLDIAFFNEKFIPYMRALHNMGMEVGSHSVSHTPYFAHIPMGSGIEKYPDYRPYFYTFTSTFNETLLGELRVSRFLLNHITNHNTTSFRSGYLTVHENLYMALQETGFKYASNITANEVLSHMPFKPMYDFMFDEELDVFEIPVTIEDELPPEMDQRIDQAINLTYKIGSYGGVVNILIHTNILGHKYRFQEAYINYFKDIAWFGTVSEYGNWWSARNSIQIDTENLGQTLKVHLTCPKPIQGLELQVPDHLKFISSQPMIGKIEKTKKGYLLSEIKEDTILIFR